MVFVCLSSDQPQNISKLLAWLLEAIVDSAVCYSLWPGEPCNNVCGLGLCDPEKMGEINSLEAMQQVLQDNFGVTSCSNGGFRSAGVPTYYPASGRCTYLSPTAQVLCEGGGFGNQLCYCKAATTTSTTRIGTLRIKHGQPYCHMFFC